MYSAGTAKIDDFFPVAFQKLNSDIYLYEDYRRFLRDKLEAGRSQPHPLPADLLSGRRKPGAKDFKRVEAALALGPRESEFFRLLVKWDAAVGDKGKRAAYDRLALHRSRNMFKSLGEDQGGYYSNPQYALIRAAIEVGDFRGDYRRLSQSLLPPLPGKVLKRCVQELADWELVKKGSRGRWEVSHPFQKPGGRKPGRTKNINREWILQAAALQERLAPDERHVSTALMTVSEKTFKSILEYMETVRANVLEMVKQDNAPGRVIQLNIQVVPRTRQIRS